MSNMSYCRFRNTAQDLLDCARNLPNNDLSLDETAAFINLVKLCRTIAEEYADYSIQELHSIALEVDED